MIIKTYIEQFLAVPNWRDNTHKQHQIQQIVIANIDVESAIFLLHYVELEPNLEFDTSELFTMIVTHCSPEQAMRCIKSFMFAPLTPLQKVILSKGSHEDIVALQAWQSSLFTATQRGSDE